MANPKIVYDPGTGPTTLNFVYPPRRVPGCVYKAVRHDNLATSGVRESVVERIDQFLELEMEWVLSGPDLSAWASFMIFALGGGQFSFYPDSSQPSFLNCWLEETDFNAQYKAPGKYTFKMTFRQAAT